MNGTGLPFSVQRRVVNLLVTILTALLLFPFTSLSAANANQIINWTKQTSPGFRAWSAISISNDGTKLAVAERGGFPYVSSDSGENWTTTDIKGSWTALASNSDGTIFAAAGNGTNILSFYNSGGYFDRGWGGRRNWSSIASSSNGDKLAAVVKNDYVYTSTDSGFLWYPQTASGSRNWSSIASSNDGTKLAALGENTYIYTSDDSGLTWETRTASGVRDWKSIASSSDGTKLAAVVKNGYIYTSIDSGLNWTQNASSGSRNWISITSSSDGVKLAAVNQGGFVYTSTDAGVNWTQSTLSGSRNWSSIASSSNGTKLAAAVDGGFIYTSDDSGVTWTERAVKATREWSSIASNSDGSIIAAVANVDFIFISTNLGTSWARRSTELLRRSIALSNDGTQIVVAGDSIQIERSANTGIEWASLETLSLDWRSIASSSDGTKLAALGENIYIYTSSDSGLTWETRIDSGMRYWRSIASSSDGTRLAALGENIYIYTSSDSGLTWETRTASGVRDWRSIASSSDGTKLAALGENTYIYTSSDSGLTWETRTASGMRSWRSIASSSDGTKLAALGENTYIYTSSDSGLTWETQTVSGARDWTSITLNSNGNRIAAAEYQGFIWTGDLQASSPAASSTLTPVVPTYRVSYLGNAAGEVTGMPTSINMFTGTKVIIPVQSPRRTGYTFLNWNSNSIGSGVKYLPGESIEVASDDITLYAQWKINSYKLLFDPNGDSLLKIDSSTREYGSALTIAALPGGYMRTGYTFMGWSSTTNEMGKTYRIGDNYIYPANDSTLYAQWKINQYAVSYDGNGSKVGRVPAGSFQDFNSTVKVAAPSQFFARSGYTFQGWNNAKDGSGKTYKAGDSFTLGAANQILYANWVANKYQVKYINTSSMTIPSGEFATGGAITQAPTPPSRKGYTFRGWSNTPSKNKLISFPYSPGVTRNISLYAVWEKNK